MKLEVTLYKYEDIKSYVITNDPRSDAEKNAHIVLQNGFKNLPGYDDVNPGACLLFESMVETLDYDWDENPVSTWDLIQEKIPIFYSPITGEKIQIEITEVIDCTKQVEELKSQKLDNYDLWQKFYKDILKIKK